MSILKELATRFRHALADLADDPEELLELLRRSQDSRFGDYQANLAMPLGKRLGRNPREVAGQIIDRLEVDDFCLLPEVAGPGFINITLRDDWIAERLASAVSDSRLGVPEVSSPKTYVIDFSAPNVAKPMHVGHIRSTVIGHGLCRTLRFLGHRVIGDNHLGDWGTQFGMILYGYRHFLDAEAYREAPVEELARLYRLVRQLVDYHEGSSQREQLARQMAEQEQALVEARAASGIAEGKKADKKTAKALRRLEAGVEKLRLERAALEAKLDAVDSNPALAKQAAEHADVASSVLAETAKLHGGEEENLRLWREFLPACISDLDRMYARLHVSFDETLGESFYHDRLEPLVDELVRANIARQSDGALCVFLEGHDVPMIVRKSDGAFLYATTDLATIRYRMDTWQPDAILYVVGQPQSLHFEQLFATARKMGFRAELQHVGFGSVLQEDENGKRTAFKTRAGDTVGLEGLLDEAVRRAADVVAENDDAKPGGPELSSEQRAHIAEVVGIGALKYVDLSHNRTSDYVFSYDKMLAMTGNTGAYMQYAYARVQSIFRKGGVDVEGLRVSGAPLLLETDAERALGLELLRLAEAIELVVADYRPNQLTSYLFELANRFSTFFDSCPVLKAESEALQSSRLLLCDLTARTLQQGLELLGIEVVEKM